jgi:hypothetical protein
MAYMEMTHTATIGLIPRSGQDPQHRSNDAGNATHNADTGTDSEVSQNGFHSASLLITLRRGATPGLSLNRRVRPGVALWVIRRQTNRCRSNASACATWQRTAREPVRAEHP